MDWGQRVSTHRGTVGAGGVLWYLGGVLLLAGVVGIVRGVAALVSGGAAQQALAGVGTLGLGALLLIVPVLRWKQTVDVFERGFVWTRIYGTVHVPREQVRSARWVQHRSRQGSHDEVEVELANGKSYSIVGVDGPEQLVNFLRAWSQGSAPLPVQQSAGWAPPPPANPQGGFSPGGWKPPGA